LLILHFLMSVCHHFPHCSCCVQCPHIPHRYPQLVNPFPLRRSIPFYLTVPRPHFRFTNDPFFTVTGCQPVAQPPTWRASPPNL
jgi:hypothetical protein